MLILYLTNINKLKKKGGNIMTKEEAYKRLEEHEEVTFFPEEGRVECEDELSAIGVDISLIKSALHQIDYLVCSIKYDGEYHLAEDLEEETDKIHNEMEAYGIDYNID